MVALASIIVNTKLAWYVARASGFVALFSVTASVLWGLWVAGRFTKKIIPAAWTLDLHRFLGGLTVTFTVIHILALVADNYTHWGWSEVFIPLASKWKGQAVAWGIVAFYLLIAVEATSLMMRKLPRKLWRYVHLSSFALFVMVLIHALYAGTDAGKPIVRHITVGIIIVSAFFAWLRFYLPKWRKKWKAYKATRVAEQASRSGVESSSGESANSDDRAARLAALKASRTTGAVASVGQRDVAPVLNPEPSRDDRAARIAAIRAARSGQTFTPPAPPAPVDEPKPAVEYSVLSTSPVESANDDIAWSAREMQVQQEAQRAAEEAQRAREARIARQRANLDRSPFSWDQPQSADGDDD